MTLPSISRFLDGWSARLKTVDDVPARALAVADLIYSYHLIGAPLPREEVTVLLDLVKAAPLAGTGAGESALTVHNTAYLLGAVNLLGDADRVAAEALLAQRAWDLGKLFDLQTKLPRWPWYYSHHSWRVSHWIGGAPSVLKSLWARIPAYCESRSWPRTEQILIACDRLVDARTGLLRAYDSDLLQIAFRNLYRLRHDPAAGDVGGVVHLHWVNYTEGRLPYKAAQGLHQRAWSVMQRAPFIEGTPYCLDFDIVQIVRTTLPQGSAVPPPIRKRADQYARDVYSFFGAGLTGNYGLHRLPGALATIHECALITGETVAYDLGIAPIDIIKDANWI
jgi:hypothetical protein